MTIKCRDKFPVSFNNSCECPSGAGAPIQAQFLPNLGVPSGLSSGRLRFLPHQKSNAGAEGVPASSDYGFGYNWMSDDSLYICPRCNPSDPARIVLGGRVIELNWDSTAGKYSGQGLEGVFASNDGKIRVAPTGPAAGLQDGSVIDLFDYNAAMPGRFKKLQVAGDANNSVEATGYTAAGHPTELRYTAYDPATSTNILHSYAYEYATGSDGNERVSTATCSRKVGAAAAEDVQRAQFAYHDGSSSSGSVGDLKTITVQEKQDGSWVTTGTSYYRYYTNPTQLHQVRYALAPDAYARLADAVGDPLAASDATVAQYAVAYQFDYQGRPTSITPPGQQATTYAYSTGAAISSTDYNKYTLKTVETRPDGASLTSYTNFHDQPILTVFKESSTAESVIDYYEYDTDGHLTLHATPSAIASNSEASGGAITVTYRSAAGVYNIGLVNLYEYYSTTTTGSGGGAAKGFLQNEKIRRGRDGTPILLRSFEYTQQQITIADSSSSSSSSSSSQGSQGGYQTSISPTIFPVAKEIIYPTDDGGTQITTTYSYTYYSGTLRIQQRTTTLPAVSSSQGGSGSQGSATRVERFDTHGSLVWLKDEVGTISYNDYSADGRLNQTIQDVDGAQLTLPSGWSTPAGGGLHLITDFEYDSAGRLTQTLGPAHTVDIGGTATTVRTATWTVYKSVTETWSAQGYATGTSPNYTFTLVNPVSISKSNAGGTRSESIVATRASTSGKLSSSDSFPQSSYVRWSVTLGDSVNGRATASRVYHTIPASGDGASGTNYDESTVGYDAMGRQNKQKTPGGTITRTVFDLSGRVSKVYVGTNDNGATDSDPTGGASSSSSSAYGSSGSSSSSSSSANAGNNMVLVTHNLYAGAAGCSTCGGGGSSQLIEVRQYVDASTYRSTQFLYDWRNRREYTIDDADDAGQVTYSRSYFDNLDRVTKSERYLDNSPSGPDANDRLLSRSEISYNARGQVWQTTVYGVDPSTGAVGNSLVGSTWYDAAGRPIKQQAPGTKLFTKTSYDSVGRPWRTYQGYDTTEPVPTGSSSSSSSLSSSQLADNVLGDMILEQSEQTYDATGAVILATMWRRLPNATGTGVLADPSGSQPRGRRSYVAFYQDAIGRSIATADYGTNGGATLSRSSVVPTRGDNILVSSTEYDSAGAVVYSTNPAGRVAKLEYDGAGRVVKQIANYIAASSSSSSSGCGASDDQNVTVQMAYNSDGNLSTLTAVNSTTGNQVTTYVFGTTLADSAIASSLLKRAEIYPDSDDTASPLGDGADATYDRVEFKYNRQGQVTEAKDQNGTVHAFDYDKVGRRTQDRVTALGSGVDGAIRRIASTFDLLGRAAKLTSLDNATVGSGNIDNETVFSYDGFGGLIADYQEHSGAVNTSTSVKVQYGFSDGSAGHVRATSMTYPNGRVLNLSYGSPGGTEDVINRVGELVDNDGSTHLVDYSYLGAGSFVKADYTEPDIRWELAFGVGSDPLDGLDRFGRVVDNRWYNYGSSADACRVQYGYDRSGSRTYREQTVDVNSNFGEVYRYDATDRLIRMDRGPLNAQKTSVSPLKFAQCWGLDATGNWREFREDADGNGTWDLVQSRSHNPVNEVSDISETSGPAWIAPLYDRAGNMTRVPKPSDPTQYHACTYDAWNRLVRFQDGANTVAGYKYDGAKRRIIKKSYSGGTLSETRHLYYTEPSKWQVIEERTGTTTNADRQFIWGLRYVDDLVLRDRNADGNANTGNCGKSGSGLEERVYALQDANWNVTALAGASGAIQERYAYSAYGTPVLLTSSFGSRETSSYDWETLYCGYRFDTLVALYHIRHRVYSPSLGTWGSRDPIRYESHECNLYRYVRSRPLLDTDPLGLLAKKKVNNAIEAQDLCQRVIDKKKEEGGEIEKGKLTDKQEKACTDWIDELKKKEEVAKVWKQFRGGCKPPDIICTCCNPGYGGFYRPMPPGIRICWNNLANKDGKPLSKEQVDEMTQVVVHESIHKLQRCHSVFDPPGVGAACQGSLQRELEAYFCDGACTDFAECLAWAIGSSCGDWCRNKKELEQDVYDRFKMWFENSKKRQEFCKFPREPDYPNIVKPH